MALCMHQFCEECYLVAQDFTQICPVCNSSFAKGKQAPVVAQPPGRAKSVAEYLSQYARAACACTQVPKKIRLVHDRGLSEIVLKPTYVVIGSSMQQKVVYNRYDSQQTENAFENNEITRFLRFGVLQQQSIYIDNGLFAQLLLDRGKISVNLDRQTSGANARCFVISSQISNLVMRLESIRSSCNVLLLNQLQELKSMKFVNTCMGKLIMDNTFMQSQEIFEENVIVTQKNAQILRSVITQNKMKGILAQILPNKLALICFKDKAVGTFKIGAEGIYELVYQYSLYEDLKKRDYENFNIPVLYYKSMNLLPIQLQYEEDSMIKQDYRQQYGVISGSAQPKILYLVQNQKALYDQFAVETPCIKVVTDVGNQVICLYTDYVTANNIQIDAIVAASINYKGKNGRQFGKIVSSIDYFCLVQWNCYNGRDQELVNVLNQFCSELVYVM